VVPEDADCNLSFATVNGNIDQQSGSRLILISVAVNGNISSHGGLITVLETFPHATPTTITGNVEMDSNTQVDICAVNISGDVTISNTNPQEVSFGAGCSGYGSFENTIGGNVSIANNNGSRLIVGYNTVGGNMSITDNLASSQSLVQSNDVTGNLTCSGNAPPPTLNLPFFGPPNTAKKLIGQCAP
jgi:hypothetical protein